MTFILELTTENRPINLYGPFKGRAEAKLWVSKQGAPWNQYLPMDPTEPPYNFDEEQA